MEVLIYDGSFEGFLSAVFYSYEYQLNTFSIQKSKNTNITFFDTYTNVITDVEKAKRVWKAIEKNCSSNGKNMILKAFLSEQPTIENLLLYFIKLELKHAKTFDKNYADAKILKIAQLVKMVNREKHRMDAFVRFKETKEGIYFALIEPDFNVLPLNAKHFTNRYADQEWIIYDSKRKYGIHYNLKTTNYITLEISNDIGNAKKQDVFFSERELAFQQLWKNYFKSTNIASRKNTKLHVQHIPKRYWKFLSEKQLN